MAKQKWTNATQYVPAKMLEDRVHFSSSDVISFIEGFESNLGEFGSEYTWKNAHKHHNVNLYRCLLDQGLSPQSCYDTLFESLYHLCDEIYPSEIELGEIADYMDAIIDDAVGCKVRGDSWGVRLFSEYLSGRTDLLRKAAGVGFLRADWRTWPELIDNNLIPLADFFASWHLLPEGKVVVGGGVRIEMVDWLINHEVSIGGLYLSCSREVLERCDSLGVLPVGYNGYLENDDRTRLTNRGDNQLSRDVLTRRLSCDDGDFEFRIANGVLRGYRGSSEHVTVPTGVSEVMGGFEGNKTIRTITLPEGVVRIGDALYYHPFAGCSNLERVALPSTIKQIEWKSFNGCDGLESIDIDQRCKKYFSVDGVAVGKQHFGIQDAYFPTKRFSGGTLVVPDGLGHVDAVFTAPVSSVKKLVLPKSIDYTQMLKENNWESLETIEVPSGSRKYKYADGALSRLNTQFTDGKRRNVLVSCLPTRTEEVFEAPAKTGAIESWAFRNCKNLEKIILPESVVRIERYAFSGIGKAVHLVLPQKLEYVFDCECEIKLFGGSFDGFTGVVEYPGTTLPFGPKAFGWSNEPDIVLMLPNIPPSDVPSALKKPAAIGYMMLRAMGDVIEDSVSEAYSKYIKSNKKKLLEAMPIHEEVATYMMEEGLLAARNLPAAISIAEEAGNVELVARLQEYSNAPKKPRASKKTTVKKQAVPVEPLVAEWLQKIKVDPTIKRTVKSGLPLASGAGECSPEALQLLIELCSFPRKHAYRAAKNNSYDYEYLDYLVKDGNTFGPGSSWLAEDERLTKPRGSWTAIREICSWVDRDVLSARLEKLFFDDKLELALVALGFLGNDAAIRRLTKEMPRWESYSLYGYRGRRDISIVRGAMMYNDSLEVVRYFAPVKKTSGYGGESLLKAYARIRRTTEDALMNKLVPVEIGGTPSQSGATGGLAFDTEGRAVINLGTKTVTATIGEDLKIMLFDDAAGKVVRSLPKRGVELEVYEREKARLATLRKSVGDAVKQRKGFLFDDYLSGSKRSVEDWKCTYLDNPILRSVARLIVWSQGKKTFTVSGTALIDSAGKPYALSTVKVRVAHPMEMDAADVEAWRSYFARNGLKQPFEQVWERVVDEASIKPDRYAGCPIPFFRFKGCEKIGIRVFDFDFHNDIQIDFVTGDCKGKTKRLDWHRHRIEMNDCFGIEDFGLYRYSRKANHLIAYLDRCSIYPRIVNNDMTLLESLDGCTLAQLIDYTNLATENGATEMAAALLAYREEHFPEYGSVNSLLV